jgi:hypothetical protein
MSGLPGGCGKLGPGCRPGDGTSGDEASGDEASGEWISGDGGFGEAGSGATAGCTGFGSA